jgi:hypothetical protein
MRFGTEEIFGCEESRIKVEDVVRGVLSSVLENDTGEAGLAVPDVCVAEIGPSAVRRRLGEGGKRTIPSYDASEDAFD